MTKRVPCISICRLKPILLHIPYYLGRHRRESYNMYRTADNWGECSWYGRFVIPYKFGIVQGGIPIQVMIIVVDLGMTCDSHYIYRLKTCYCCPPVLLLILLNMENHSHYSQENTQTPHMSYILTAVSPQSIPPIQFDVVMIYPHQTHGVWRTTFLGEPITTSTFIQQAEIWLHSILPIVQN